MDSRETKGLAGRVRVPGGKPRIGIYGGSFDPVHAGHVAFALQALKSAQLDRVYFLPERRPHNKRWVEHFGHRVAMLKRAIAPYARFGVLELEDVSFTVGHTLPRLQKRFSGAELIFLFGSNTMLEVPRWDHAERLLAHGMVVGVRPQQPAAELDRLVGQWKKRPLSLLLLDSYAADVSAHSIRQALGKRQYAKGLLSSVARYSNRNWLYVSLA